MISKEDLQVWLDTLPADELLAMDDGGLTLLGLNTGTYIEIGGEPEPEEQ